MQRFVIKDVESNLWPCDQLNGVLVVLILATVAGKIRHFSLTTCSLFHKSRSHINFCVIWCDTIILLHIVWYCLFSSHFSMPILYIKHPSVYTILLENDKCILPVFFHNCWNAIYRGCQCDDSRHLVGTVISCFKIKQSHKPVIKTDMFGDDTS